jgi:TonB family protein
MIQTDKERLAISSAIAVVLYAGVLGATAWLDILQPAEPIDYGELTVQVALQEPEPTEIMPPETEEAPPEVEPVMEPEPEIERVPPPEPERVPPPEPERAPQTEPQPTTQPERAPPVTRAEVESPGAPAGTLEPGPKSAPPGGETASEPASEEASGSTSEAAAGKTTPYFGETEIASAPPEESGSEYFKSYREDVPQDQFGEDEIKYGSESPTRNDRPTDTALNTNADTSAGESEFIDLTPLNSVRFPGEGAGDGQNVDGDGPGTRGDGTADTDSVIEADSFDELMSKRLVEQPYDPDLSDIGLPDGLRRMNVQVEFDIRRDGAVVAVRVADTGDPKLNAAIGQALRRWRFQPIQQDIRQTAKLLYIIEATETD